MTTHSYALTSQISSQESQHGFLKHRSCLTNLLEFLDFVTNYIDQGYPIDVIYLDFQKAFDKVPHKRLKMKINAMGITGDVFYWIEDWLNDRESKELDPLMFF